MMLTKIAIARVAGIPVSVLDDNVKLLCEGLKIKLPKVKING